MKKWIARAYLFVVFGSMGGIALWGVLDGLARISQETWQVIAGSVLIFLGIALGVIVFFATIAWASGHAWDR